MDIMFLKKLLATPTVSGFETAGTKAFIDYLKDNVDTTYIDPIGNAIVKIGKEDKKLKLMLEAHIDEIGYQVLYISKAGYLYLRRNGGIDVQCIPGTQVLIYTNSGKVIPGVIGKKPIHLLTPDERNKNIEVERLWVDTGLEVKEVKKTISIGDVIVTKPNITQLSKNRISSKALDNKIGVFIVAEVIKKLTETPNLKMAIWGVATVQEEVGGRGAIASGYSTNPNIAISIDVDFATDVPDCPSEKYGEVSLGKGPVLAANLDNAPQLMRQAESIAKKSNIPYQVSARPYCCGGTNSSKIQLSRQGVRTLSIGIPCRYMHTPVEVCDLRDIKAAIELIVEITLDLNKKESNN